MSVEIAFVDPLKEPQVHLLSHRGPFIPKEVVIIREIRAEHRQFGALSQQFASKSPGVELPSGKDPDHIGPLQVQWLDVEVLRREIDLHQHVMVDHELELLFVVPRNAESFKHRFVSQIHLLRPRLLQRLQSHQVRVPPVVLCSQSLPTVQADAALLLVAAPQLPAPRAIPQLGRTALSIKRSVGFVANYGPNAREHRAEISGTVPQSVRSNVELRKHFLNIRSRQPVLLVVESWSRVQIARWSRGGATARTRRWCRNVLRWLVMSHHPVGVHAHSATNNAVLRL